MPLLSLFKHIIKVTMKRTDDFCLLKKNKTTSTKNKNILTIEEYSGLKINATYFYILDPCFLLFDNGSEFHFSNVPYMYQKNFIST